MMQEIIKELKEKGVVDKIQHCLNSATKLFGDVSDEVKLKANAEALIRYIANVDDEELQDKFVDFATDYAARAIIKELDLKADENYKPTSIDKLVGIRTLLEKLL